MGYEYKDKIAVVTGAGSGIGRSTALLLASRGAKVHVTDLRADTAEKVAAEIAEEGGHATAHTVDVSDAAAVQALADAVRAEDGRCDILHNNAGMGHIGNIEAIPLEDWRKVVGVNLMGVVHGIHAFLPLMLEQDGGAKIINTASMTGLYPWPGYAPYAASKFAVVGLTESLHAELKPKGIQVSAICPGVTDTPIANDAVMRGEAEELRVGAIEMMGKIGTSPDNVAKAVLGLIESGKPLAVAPAWQVLPVWMVHRASPRAGILLASVAEKATRAIARR